MVCSNKTTEREEYESQGYFFYANKMLVYSTNLITLLAKRFLKIINTWGHTRSLKLPLENRKSLHSLDLWSPEALRYGALGLQKIIEIFFTWHEITHSSLILMKYKLTKTIEHHYFSWIYQSILVLTVSDLDLGYKDIRPMDHNIRENISFWQIDLW